MRAQGKVESSSSVFRHDPLVISMDMTDAVKALVDKSTAVHARQHATMQACVSRVESTADAYEKIIGQLEVRPEEEDLENCFQEKCDLFKDEITKLKDEIEKAISNQIELERINGNIKEVNTKSRKQLQ